MISKSRDQKQCSDLGWISWIDLGIQPIKALIGQEPAHIQMTCEPEEWILGSDWGLRAFATNWINGLKMIMTRDANKITGLMGLNIIQASKNFKSNRLLRIFGRSDSISKNFENHTNNWGWTNPRWVRGIIRRGGIHGAKNCKAVSSKDSQNNRENFGVSCNNKINWETLY